MLMQVSEYGEHIQVMLSSNALHSHKWELWSLAVLTIKVNTPGFVTNNKPATAATVSVLNIFDNIVVVDDDNNNYYNYDYATL